MKVKANFIKWQKIHIPYATEPILQKHKAKLIKFKGVTDFVFTIHKDKRWSGGYFIVSELTTGLKICSAYSYSAAKKSAFQLWTENKSVTLALFKKGKKQLKKYSISYPVNEIG